jgi:hypothetical protein
VCQHVFGRILHVVMVALASGNGLSSAQQAKETAGTNFRQRKTECTASVPAAPEAFTTNDG